MHMQLNFLMSFPRLLSSSETCVLFRLSARCGFDHSSEYSIS